MTIKQFFFSFENNENKNMLEKYEIKKVGGCNCGYPKRGVLSTYSKCDIEIRNKMSKKI